MILKSPPERMMPTFISVLLLLVLGSRTEKGSQSGSNLGSPSEIDQKKKTLDMSHLSPASHVNWSYQDQDQWPVNFPACGGIRQSPVPLPDYCSFETQTVLNNSLKLEFFNFDHKLFGDNLILTNNGHSAQVTLIGSDKKNDLSPRVTLKPGNDLYQFVQLHFHWDQNNTHGSEHSLHGTKEALEMHLVHFNTKYETFDNSATKPDGLLVIAVLYDNHDDDYAPLKTITKHLPQVLIEGSSVTMNGSNLVLDHLLPKLEETFYMYQGSLTTPPCYESVTWIIYPSLGTVSKSQLSAFQSLDNKENHHLGNTYRIEQPLNGRKVQVSNDDFC